MTQKYYSPRLNPTRNVQEPVFRTSVQNLQQEAWLKIRAKREIVEGINELPPDWAPSTPPEVEPSSRRTVTVVPGPGFARAMLEDGTYITGPTTVELPNMFVTRRIRDGSMQLFRPIPEEAPPVKEEESENAAEGPIAKSSGGPSKMGPGTVVSAPVITAKTNGNGH